MKHSNVESKKIIDFLNEIFIGEEIFQEEDTELNRIIYMPESIKKMIQVPVVDRMNRILQTGANVYDNIKMIGTRMQHSKGTYSLMLELLSNLWQKDEEFKQRIIENKQQKYIKAILVKEMLHDLRHGPFSHTLEVVCDLPKGFHEEIGKRLMKENGELNKALNNIEKGLPELIDELDENDTLGLNRLCEGQFDLDRADFLSRDSFFSGKDYKKFMNIVQELINNVKIKEITDEDAKKYLIPVFNENQISNIEQFLQIHIDNYNDLYISNSKHMYEQIFKSFAARLKNSTEETPLKKFLQDIQGKTPEEVDLSVYTSFDDIQYLKETIRVVQKTENIELKKLALMTLPKMEIIPGLYYGMMVSSNKRVGVREQLSDSDEQFIKDMKLIDLEKNKICDNKDFIKENCLLLDSEDKSEIEMILARSQIVLTTGKNNKNVAGIKFWVKRKSFYKNKQGEEIYIASNDGGYYEYSTHPQRTKSIKDNIKVGMCIIIPELIMDGCSQAGVQKIRMAIDTFNNIKQQDDVDR